MQKEKSVQTENKMGVMPVNQLLLSMSLPMMISMLVQALYNIVDSIFVSRVNEYALRAVSLAFPIQSLMIAVGVGTAVGINSFLFCQPDLYPGGAGLWDGLSDDLLHSQYRHFHADGV